MHCRFVLIALAAMLCSVAAAPVASPEALPEALPALPEANTLEARATTYTGKATWYTQDNNYGSCGKKNSDSALIVAMNTPQVKGGSHCGKKVKITNKSNKKTVTATVADECPGCGWGSLDLSTGAFKKIGNLDTGVLSISWVFV